MSTQLSLPHRPTLIVNRVLIFVSTKKVRLSSAQGMFFQLYARANPHPHYGQAQPGGGNHDGRGAEQHQIGREAKIDFGQDADGHEQTGQGQAGNPLGLRATHGQTQQQIAKSLIP
jgi:hypothetical protein